MTDCMTASWATVSRGDDTAMIPAAGGVATVFTAAGDHLLHGNHDAQTCRTPCMRAERNHAEKQERKKVT
jgi:hypothetical protein